MHISEGVLGGELLMGGAVIAACGVALGLKKLDYSRVPTVAVLTSAFFVASLIRIPFGPGSVHLSLNGLSGLVLGYPVFPALLVGLALQAVLFQFGGITTLGINTLNMALPALAVYLIFGKTIRTGSQGRRAFKAAGFFAGFLGSTGAAAMVSATLWLNGAGFEKPAALLFASNLPAAFVEGLITMVAVSFIKKVKPEVF